MLQSYTQVDAINKLLKCVLGNVVKKFVWTMNHGVFFPRWTVFQLQTGFNAIGEMNYVIEIMINHIWYSTKLRNKTTFDK